MAIAALLYALTGVILYMAFSTNIISLSIDVSALQLIIAFLMLPLTIKLVIQLTAASLYGIREKLRTTSGLLERNPRVSVIVPAWNEEVGILKTMQSVIATNYPNLELIVVNDGSTDRTHEIVTEFVEQHQAKVYAENAATIKYLKLENGGKANAMNQALTEVTGEFVFTLDADSYMDSKAIVNMLKQFGDDERVGAVAGNVIVGNRKRKIALLQQLEYVTGFFFKRADSMFDSVYIIGGAAAAYRKTVLDAVGGFDHGIITEDIELSVRILANGYKTRYAYDSVVYTEGPSDFRGLRRQRTRWKFGRLLTFIKYKSLFFNTQLGNPYLTFLILPVAVLSEILLLLEPLLLTFFYGYIIISNSYVVLASIIALVSFMVFVQIQLDYKSKFHSNIIMLAPIAWILFYVVDLVEFMSLCHSIKKVVRKQKLEWQVWKRVGIVDAI